MKFASFNLALGAFWGVITKFDLRRRNNDYEVFALKGRIREAEAAANQSKAGGTSDGAQWSNEGQLRDRQVPLVDSTETYGRKADSRQEVDAVNSPHLLHVSPFSPLEHHQTRHSKHSALEGREQMSNGQRNSRKSLSSNSIASQSYFVQGQQNSETASYHIRVPPSDQHNVQDAKQDAIYEEWPTQTSSSSSDRRHRRNNLSRAQTMPSPPLLEMHPSDYKFVPDASNENNLQYL
ncbi:uncharacterized protein LOC142343861 [Convolutriloba macropyga]|uniref:uncharacterized protein LOC142343861 n=1 Tax=Convolutriloba macropyga TaxID=536237 RepID=UPI003F521B6C